MEIGRIIDLSQPLVGGHSNPAFPKSILSNCLSYERDGWTAETITAATHLGSHIDAPAHRLEHGRTIDEYSLDRFHGPAMPIDLFHKGPGEEITDLDLEPYRSQFKRGDVALLCTGWGEIRNRGDAELYIHGSPWLGRDACRLLIEVGVNAVGIDHFSIGGTNPEHVEIPHEMLMGADILILEDLHLPHMLLGKAKWHVFAFPIMIGMTSGSFSRVVAIEDLDPA